MKLIERPDKEAVKAIQLNAPVYDPPWCDTPQEMSVAVAKFRSDIYNFCCEHYERELERIQKLIDGATDRDRVYNEITLIKNELIRLREERE